MAAVVAGATAGTTVVAALLFDRWECQESGSETFALPGVPGLAFSSPQTLELARQVKPFLDKNNERLRAEADAYVNAATTSWDTELAARRDDLSPGEGEVIVLAEADPQGSFVGAEVRAFIYDSLLAELGEDAVALRTISGDVSSNGTVAEARFIAVEAAVGGGIPVAAVAGDHDSSATIAQMQDNGMTVPHLETKTVGGLRVTGGNDPERKALFGALISNDTGITERGLGEAVREAVDPESAGIVLLHQPRAAAGYLGVGHPRDLAEVATSLTEPVDDGIPDLPPGIVEIGHLHDLEGPWVVWNTGGERVTWTVVDQLGTSGGVLERPTFNRFSTPTSAPLKPVAVRLQYVDRDSGLMTGYVTLTCSLEGECSLTPRTDVGLPLREPDVAPPEQPAGDPSADALERR